MILEALETQTPARRKPRTAKPKASGSRTAPRSENVPARKQASLSSGSSLANFRKKSSLAPALPVPVSEAPAAPSSDGGLWAAFLQVFRKMRAPQKRLRVCESVSLGDKRFLAIVRVDSESFLLGGSTGSVSMLAKLNDPGTFTAVLQQQSVGAGSSQ